MIQLRPIALLITALALRSAMALNGPATTSQPSFAPRVTLQNQDYAEVRKTFHTRLLHTGPAPQKWEQPKSADGVDEVEYRSGDLRLKAWLSKPPAGEPRKSPAVLFLHGGFAFDRGDWQMSQPYRDAGFVVMTPILRGENGQPGAFSAYYDEVTDVLAAAELLRGLPYVDPDHLFIAGHSAGGTIALLAAMSSKNFRAAASFSGCPDFLVMRSLGPEIVPDSHFPFDTADPREFLVRSPLAYAASFKCPVRLFWGSQEPWFKEINQKTAQVAKDHHLDAEATEIEGDHQSAVPKSMAQSIEFFKKRL